ncbi:interferon a3-like [Acipenser ruthenus]|uniref:interferon a3-like n=1 Tax=Acipenser ruthenus TaxID=7906 RepID=UPI00145B22DD|nr:interferon a3-like [Acipenser ruthenus]
MGRNIFAFCFVLSLLCGCCSSLGCKWIKDDLYKPTSKETMNLLKHMGKEFVKERAHMHIPPKAYKMHKHIKLGDNVFEVYEAFLNISKIFNLNQDSVTTWNRTALDIFRNNLYRQTKELKSCMQEMKYSENRRSNEIKTLESYFKKLEHFLENKNYSARAWEVIRIQVQDNLERMDRFTAHIRTHMMDNSNV